MQSVRLFTLGRTQEGKVKLVQIDLVSHISAFCRFNPIPYFLGVSQANPPGIK